MRPLAPERAWEYLLTILARQAYTADELRRKLRQRGIGADQAEGFLARLRELRLIDDALYAQQYVSSRKDQRGRRWLHQALRRKGVAEDLVASEIGSLGEAQQTAAATALLQRFAWRYHPRAGVGPTDDAATGEAAGGTPDPDANTAGDARRMRARAFAFLARRGFGAEAADMALERVGWFDELR